MTNFADKVWMKVLELKELPKQRGRIVRTRERNPQVAVGIDLRLHQKRARHQVARRRRRRAERHRLALQVLELRDGGVGRDEDRAKFLVFYPLDQRLDALANASAYPALAAPRQ